MGFFGGLFSKIKSCASDAVDKVKRGVSHIKEKVTNVWNGFTGKKYFDEAEDLYKKITKRYNSRRKQFEDELEHYTDLIENHVNNINKSKEKIKRELFPEMAHKLEKIKDISVSGDFTLEKYKVAVLSTEGVRSKSALYKIDFNKHKFKTTIQAIFTLGIYTRKKAKETLYAVQEEEGKINTEIAKMDAEMKKLQVIQKSLDNVEKYFTSLIELYGNLLVRLDNSVNFLYVRCMSFVHRLVHKEMSIRRLPVMQRKEVEAIITASKILKAMTDAQITSLEDKEKVNKYSKDMKGQYTELNKVYEAA